MQLFAKVNNPIAQVDKITLYIHYQRGRNLTHKISLTNRPRMADQRSPRLSKGPKCHKMRAKPHQKYENEASQKITRTKPRIKLRERSLQPIVVKTKCQSTKTLEVHSCFKLQ